MTKEQLIEDLAKKYDIENPKMKKIINEMLDVMSQAIQKDGKMELYGFGKFIKNHYNSRRGINPQTGKPLVIPAREGVRFKPSKKLKEIVNDK